jgi:signal transduction histidine kinase
MKDESVDSSGFILHPSSFILSKEGASAVTEPAEQERSAPSRIGNTDWPSDESLLEAVTSLPWLAPAAGSLAALARVGAASWPGLLRFDPGAVLLLVRCEPAADPALYPSSLFDTPAPLEFALRRLAAAPCGFIDWTGPAYRASLAIARRAKTLAQRSGRVHPEAAWVAGLLAPLGSLAISGVAPSRLTRRLARAWQLPDWLARIVGLLEFPLEQARRLGADPALFAVVRLAADLACAAGHDLGLTGGTDLAEEEQLLGLRREDVRACPVDEGPPAGLVWDDPYRQGLLTDLLAVAADNARLRQAPLVARLEREADDLHEALREKVRGEAERLRQSKLAALAEFSAGAGHEINNPLAVISGQAQYLLSHENDWLAADTSGGARTALQTIIAQTKRIHGILRDLMLFARPMAPRPAWLDLPTLLGEVAAGLAELAGQKQVRVEVTTPERLSIHADGDQVRQALACLLRNAVEAAGSGGWARLVLAECGPADRALVLVEDSGPGPSAEQRPHLFDPFYSGRSAGRGKGLGLPVAWRLARLQGGNVCLEPAQPGAPTRFVLSLPRATPPAERSAA